jgi:hypothetical protein
MSRPKTAENMEVELYEHKNWLANSLPGPAPTVNSSSTESRQLLGVLLSK